MAATLFKQHAHATEREPVISVLMPFEPKITPRELMNRQIESTINAVNDELDRHYSNEETSGLMAKFRKVISQLNYSTYRKSVAIYISAGTDKIFYLDIEVEPGISVEEPLTMRNVVQHKKDVRNYLVLHLSTDRATIYNGHANGMKRIVSVTPENMGAYLHDGSLPEKFLYYADHALSMLLVNYPFPVLVIATERTGSHFKKITSNQLQVISYINGNFDDAPENSLRMLIASSLAQWDKLIQQQLLKLVNQAMVEDKLAVGVREVNSVASFQRGGLLVMEKNFRYRIGMPDESEKNSRPLYLYDKVDEAIASVLENGGSVQFIDDGALARYKHIALIKN